MISGGGELRAKNERETALSSKVISGRLGAEETEKEKNTGPVHR